jgi:hypothetical protein
MALKLSLFLYILMLRFPHLLSNVNVWSNVIMKSNENEYHFLKVCPFYRQLRFNILPNHYCHWPGLQNSFTNLTFSAKNSRHDLCTINVVNICYL